MYFAINDNKLRVYADEAEKDENYYCPVCGNKVLLKRGDINAAHFAHEKNECADRWNYDMSEWHIRMQELFPVENREVIVTYKGVKHRADILKNGIVIEFQHSPISAEEFCERNDFYRNAGYKIAWVFDVSQQYYDGSLYYDEESDKELYIWKNPKRLFQFAPNPSDYDKNFSVWLYWENDCDDDCEVFFYKVIWSSKDDYDNPSYKRIILSNFVIEVNRDIRVEEFLYSKQDYAYEAVREATKNRRYFIRYSGIKGKPRECYICPKQPKEFGLPLYGEHGCFYCKHCAIILEKNRSNSKEKHIYCCYPEIVQTSEGHPGYESNGADRYEI